MKYMVFFVTPCILIMAWSPVVFSEVSGPQIAEEPRYLIDTKVISAGKVIRVGAGGSLQTALMRAKPGDTIELEAGAVFQGPFILPYKPTSSNPDFQWITIRSSESDTTLPPSGVRVSPGDAVAMARLESPSGAIVSAAPGAHHYRFIGIEFQPTRSSPKAPSGFFLNTLIHFGADEASGEKVPHHLIIERSYLHGDPQIGARRGIIMNSATTAVVDSYLADFKMVGHDSQAIIGWEGPGPYLIRNNYLEASGENLLFGGADPTIQDRVPADIVIRGNHISKPIAWMVGSHSYAGSAWTVKNLLELKNARRVLIDGNLLEYNWVESQNGFAILFTVRNQDGLAPWSVVEDVIFSNNIVRHVGNGINILGWDNNYPSQRTRRIVIRNNLFTDLGGAWGAGHLIQLLDGTEDIVIERNIAIHSGNILRAEGRQHKKFVFRNNIVRHNGSGIVGTDSTPGNAVLDRYFDSAVVHKNLIMGGSADTYPPGNIFPGLIGATEFTDEQSGDFRLDRATFNQPTGRTTGVDFSELCSALSVTEQPPSCTTVP